MVNRTKTNLRPVGWLRDDGRDPAMARGVEFSGVADFEAEMNRMPKFTLLAMDVVNLKISKLGGLTKTKQVRDLCVSMGIAMTLEDSWGGDIITAAIAHLAHSTPEEFRFTSTDFNSYVTVSIADGAPQRVNGFMAASTAPGLGITPKRDVLGPRVVDVSSGVRRGDS